MAFSPLNFNVKQDWPEQKMWLEAKTRGVNIVSKEVFTGTKKACVFAIKPVQISLEDSLSASNRDNEYVFDRRDGFYDL
jgi:hypothetical protein